MTENDLPSNHELEISCEYSNETMKLLFERSSCRDFSPQKIPQNILKKILAAGTHAPSGGNLQPYSIIKIENEKMKERLAELGEQGFIKEAPVLLLFCIDWHRIRRWANIGVAPFSGTSSFRHFWISFQDTIICAQNIGTAADSMGLGSVYIGTVIEFFSELRKMFRLPKEVFPVVLLCLGYPKKRPSPRNKLGVDVIVHEERYQELSVQDLMDAFKKKYDWKIEITEKRLQTIFEVCSKAHGDEFAHRCIKKIKESGYINQVQWYFGLHYRAHSELEHRRDNEEYLRIMKEFGFNWFEKSDSE